MRSVIQRVKNANCVVDNKFISKIENGLDIFVGFTDNDNNATLVKFVDKILKLRIFTDSNDKMNLSIQDTKGEILLISQFTLYGDITRTNRPSFITALNYNDANKLYLELLQLFQAKIPTYPGVFGGDMQITQTNDGPVSIIYEI